MSRTGESRSAPDHGTAALAQTVVLGMLVMLAGTLPRNLLFAANLRLAASVPWAVPVTAAYLWCYWRYLGGQWEPADTSAFRRQSLRANRLPAPVWMWALFAGGLGLVALVFGLRLANRLVLLPPQQMPDLTGIPHWTIWSLLLMSAPVAGIVEEAAFRGYMQGPIERIHGLFIATLITGTMFALALLATALVTAWAFARLAATVREGAISPTRK
jgi:membrane protease YdiL (CAAX protease family)